MSGTRAASAALLVLTLAATAHAATERRLHVRGSIASIAPLDLDGDGLAELCVLSQAAEPKQLRPAQLLSVFRQRDALAFAPEPDIVLELDPAVVAVDVLQEASRGTRAPGGGASWIYALTPTAILAYELDGQANALRPRTVHAVNLPHLVPADGGVAVVDFARPWLDERLGFLLPDFPEPRIVIPHETGSTQWQLPVEPFAVYGGEARRLSNRQPDAWSMDFAFALPLVADQNGDGRKDLVLLQRNRFIVLEQPPSLPSERAAVNRKLQPRVYELSGGEAPAGPANERSYLADLDGNGRIDLLRIEFEDVGLIEYKGSVAVHFARADGSISAQPNQRLEIPDALYQLVLPYDLDAEGEFELIAPATKVGVFGLIRLLTTRRVSFDFVTLPLADQRYRSERASRDPLVAKLSHAYEIPVLQLPDLNGDGLSDLVLGTTESRICVYPGQREGSRRFASRPQECLEADPYTQYQHHDLNGDGKEELIRFGPAAEKSQDFFVTSF